MDPRMTCIDHKNMNVLIKSSMRRMEIGTDTSVTVFYILIL